MKFQLLGPVEVRIAGRVLELGPPQQRSVLAVLLAEAGQVVHPETLIDRVWDDAPAAARRTLHVYLTRIRRLLEQASATGTGPVRLIRRSGGYVLDVGRDQIDLYQFRRLVARACDAGCSVTDQVTLLREAVGLWRGEPLSGVRGPWAASTRPLWQEEYVNAVVRWAEAELHAGDPAAAIGPLSKLAGECPLAESVTAALMRALHAVGRTPEALDRYAHARRLLVDQLGVDPGRDLQQLHQSLLRGEMDRPVGSSPPPQAPCSPIPAQLPPDLRPFTGRELELVRLDEIAAAASDETVAVIVALSGTAGVGKTALAVHWAWKARGNFPGGVLYVNLRGFDPGGSPTEPAAAVRRFLDALGVTPPRIPTDLDAQVALYRSLLVGRPTLVVLDNARDADQVRPLLPGCPGSLALITSRSQLSSLAAIEGAHPITVGLMSQQDALQLLGARLGTERVSSELAAATRLVTGCAGLPLALAIVAARAANQPELKLSVLADQVTCEARRLDVLTAGDAASEMRAVFSWSYRPLSHTAAALYRLLGLHPGPEISAPAAASLAAIPHERVLPLLDELVGGNLLIEHPPGRYAIHDLLRTYAAELAATTDTDGHRHDATRRMLDHYVHTAFSAARLLDPARAPIDVASPAPAGSPEPILDHQEAAGWLTTELPTLLLLVDHAAPGWDTHTCQLAWTLSTFLYRRGLWHEQVMVQRAAVAAAHRLAEPAVEARAHNNLADAYVQMGRYGLARNHLQDAINLGAYANDQLSQGHTHHRFAILCGRQGHHHEALEHAREAMTLYEAAGYHAGQADGLNALGWFHAQLGEYHEAIIYCQQALTLHQNVDNRAGQADTWDSLGYAHHHLGHYSQAATCYENAIRIYRDIGDRYGLADSLVHLGDTHHSTGDPDAATAA